MRRIALSAAFFFIVAMVPAARGEVVAPDEGVFQEPREGGIEEMDKGKEKACNCCQECMAAMKSTKGKEEGPPQTSGCRDCCKKCGKKQPLDKTLPPDIVR